MDLISLEKANNIRANIHTLDKKIKALDKAVSEIQFLIEQSDSDGMPYEIRIVYGDGRGINIDASNIIDTLQQIGIYMDAKRKKLDEEFKSL